MKAGLLIFFKKYLWLRDFENLCHEFEVGDGALEIRFRSFILHAILGYECVDLSLFLASPHMKHYSFLIVKTSSAEN